MPSLTALMSKSQQEPAAAANGKAASSASAAAGAETAATGDEGPLTLALQVVEKKVRNLEKRKVRSKQQRTF